MPVVLPECERVQVWGEEGDQRGEPEWWAMRVGVRDREEGAGGGESAHRAGGVGEAVLHELLPAAREVRVQCGRADGRAGRESDGGGGCVGVG